MTAISTRKVTRMDQSKGATNELSETGSLLSKHKVAPSKRHLDHAHGKSQKPAPRRGQIIDVLV